VLGWVQHLGHIAQGRGLAAADVAGHQRHGTDAHRIAHPFGDPLQRRGYQDVLHVDIGGERLALHFEKGAIHKAPPCQKMPPLLCPWL
jgi:hypothetical protein